MTPELNVFVDEYGDTSIAVEKQGVSGFFIITAVFLGDDVEKQRQAAEDIRLRFFQRGEMKASAVGRNDQRRKNILEELMRLNIRTYTLAVDKRELERESGLAYKGSFFKCLHRRLYQRVYRLYENVKIIADEHGTEDFMRGFQSYLDRELPSSLFGVTSFSFARSKGEVLLQVADFISGSLARVLDPAKLSADAKSLLELLAGRSIGIEVWPPRFLPDPRLFAADTPSSRHDELIRRHCMRQAEIFIESNLDAPENDEQTRARIDVLLFLIFRIRFGDAQEYVSTDEIIEHLETRAGIRMTTHQIRSVVVAQLRDANVILASSSRGYKIPVCEKDISEFLAHANAIVPPMLARVRRARDELKLASLGELDTWLCQNSVISEHLWKLIEAD